MTRRAARRQGGRARLRAPRLRARARQRSRRGPPDPSGLELLESWSRAAGVVERPSSRPSRPASRSGRARSGLRPTSGAPSAVKLAEVYARELAKLDEAVAAYRELVEADPADAETVAALDALLRANERKDDLRWLFDLRAKQVEGEARADVLEEWATLEEEVFGDAAPGHRALRARSSRSRRGTRPCARSRGSSSPPGSTRPRPRSSPATAISSEGDDRARREVELATLYLERLDRAGERVRGLRARARRGAPTTPRRSRSSRGSLDKPETRVRAATVLEEEYARRSATAGASRRPSASASRPRRTRTRAARLHLKLADVEEKKLGAAGTAFEVILRALNEFPGDLELWGRAAELAARAGRPTDLAEAYRLHLVANRAAAARRCPRPSRSSSASAPPACTTSSSATPRARCRTSIASSRSTPPTSAPSTA